MHVISKRPFIEAARKYPNQRDALLKIHKTLSSNSARFESPDEMRRVFPSLDNFSYVGKWWVLDVGGNQLRMIACILFAQNSLYVKHIVSHAEYDRLCERYRRGDLP